MTENSTLYYMCRYDYRGPPPLTEMGFCGTLAVSHGVVEARSDERAGQGVWLVFGSEIEACTVWLGGRGHWEGCVLLARWYLDEGIGVEAVSVSSSMPHACMALVAGRVPSACYQVRGSLTRTRQQRRGGFIRRCVPKCRRLQVIRGHRQVKSHQHTCMCNAQRSANPARHLSTTLAHETSSHTSNHHHNHPLSTSHRSENERKCSTARCSRTTTTHITSSHHSPPTLPIHYASVEIAF
ncbi:hypothetical protein IWX49DRAFT_76763 [Phyllosticta citricarpa]|uniref:Uncharacterized protein n=1 Tax=Phyllosticta citricarpa TaxID=55181 RepID=A0ABR1LSZ6_9PEZI